MPLLRCRRMRAATYPCWKYLKLGCVIFVFLAQIAIFLNGIIILVVFGHFLIVSLCKSIRLIGKLGAMTTQKCATKIYECMWVTVILILPQSNLLLLLYIVHTYLNITFTQLCTIMIDQMLFRISIGQYQL